MLGPALLGDAIVFELIAIERLDHARTPDIVLKAGVQLGDRLSDALVLRFDLCEELRAP